MKDIKRIALFLNNENKDIKLLRAEILDTALCITRHMKSNLKDALYDACLSWDCLDENSDFLQP